MIVNLNDPTEDEIIEDDFTEDDFTNEITVYLNLPSVKIHRKLAHNKQSERLLIEWKAQPFNIEASDPELVLLGGLEAALKFLDRHKVRNGQLRIYVPSAEIAETLNNQECTNPQYKDLWEAFFCRINRAGHTVEALVATQDQADRQTEEVFTIVPKPKKPEVWKPVEGTKGLYEISSHGQVYSHHKNGRILKPVFQAKGQCKDGTPKGYYHVSLCVPGHPMRKPRVDHLVLEAFHGPRPKGFDACHYDDDPSNNHVSNLRWDTRSNNKTDSTFTNSAAERAVTKLRPNQKVICWDPWDERDRTMSG